MTARLNIEPETVIAWTVIMVGIYYAVVLAGKLARHAAGMVTKTSHRRRTKSVPETGNVSQKTQDRTDMDCSEKQLAVQNND